MKYFVFLYKIRPIVFDTDCVVSFDKINEKYSIVDELQFKCS